jgi:uncharacterized protein
METSREGGFMKLPHNPLIAKLILACILACLLIVCSSSQSNAVSIINDLKIKAGHGEVEAQTILGLKYANGEGVSQDYKQAIYWLTKSAEQGDVKAQYSLGRMYFYGTGKPKNLFDEIFDESTKMNELGYADIENDLAEINGEGVAKDYQQAIYWLTKAAEQGHINSQFLLGEIYRNYNGKGWDKDYKQAFKWYMKSAEQDHAGAQYSLGAMYYNGKEGVAQNYQQAIYWLTKAAEQGNTEAQVCLGTMYYKGEGIKNYSYSYAWNNLAASQGYKEAIKKRDKVAELLSPKQLTKAQEISLELQQKIDNRKRSSSQKRFIFGEDERLRSTETYKKNGFSITLPTGWIEIPREEIDEYENGIATIAPDASVKHFDYGFQSETALNWFEYPYMIIRIDNNGRIVQSALEEMAESIDNDMFNTESKGLSQIMSDIKLGQAAYDKKSRMVWMYVEFNMENFGPVSGISGIIPTEKGFIQVNGYSRREDFSTYENIFKLIAESVLPEPEIVYKPRWSDNLPPFIARIHWEKVIGKAIAGAILAGVVSSIYALIGALRKKKNGSDISNI